MFFGWGTSTIKNPVHINQNQAVILRYKYFVAMFIFSLTFGYSYSLATNTADGWHYRSLSREDASQLLGGKELRPNWWWRFSLPVAIAFVVINLTLHSLY